MNPHDSVGGGPRGGIAAPDDLPMGTVVAYIAPTGGGYFYDPDQNYPGAELRWYKAARGDGEWEWVEVYDVKKLPDPDEEEEDA